MYVKRKIHHLIKLIKMLDENSIGEIVESKIYTVRGCKVMLDRDLAGLFDVKPYRLREQVKRNLNKFPGHFMFQLTNEETEFMVSQNAIPLKKHLGGSLPYVFTEHGILQLSNVLKSDLATRISVRIIEIFVKMREMIIQNKDLFIKIQELEKRMDGNDESIEMVMRYLRKFIEDQKKPRKEIGFKQKGKP